MHPAYSLLLSGGMGKGSLGQSLNSSTHSPFPPSLLRTREGQASEAEERTLPPVVLPMASQRHQVPRKFGIGFRAWGLGFFSEAHPE